MSPLYVNHNKGANIWKDHFESASEEFVKKYNSLLFKTLLLQLGEMLRA